MYVDSHCHLSFPGLVERLPEIRAAMADAAVDRALCICTTLEEFDDVHALATGHDNFWCSVGVHPDSEEVREPSLADLATRAALPKVVAIGETGLDYYRLEGRSVDEMAWQRERFRVHIEASVSTGLPLVIHTRSASDDTLAVLRDASAGRATGVFHCFTETEAVARAALDLGFYISFSGILTFKTAAALREVARFVPLDRCLIETDSPYLAPVPFRGKTNTPAWVPHVAAQVAALKGLPVERVAEATSRNFERLFKLPQPSQPTRPMTDFHLGRLAAGLLALGASLVLAAAPDDFFVAIRNDNVGALKSLLQHGVDPNTRSEKGQPGLVVAMQEQSPKAARLLLEQPTIDIDALNNAGESALMIAALKGDIADVKLLLARGAKVDLPGWSPLHYAATGPEAAIVRLLLDRGAAIDAPSPNGSTPLMLAAQYGSEDSVKLLLERGADARLRNQKNLAALDFARLGGREYMVKRFEALPR